MIRSTAPCEEHGAFLVPVPSPPEISRVSTRFKFASGHPANRLEASHPIAPPNTSGGVTVGVPGKKKATLLVSSSSHAMELAPQVFGENFWDLNIATGTPANPFKIGVCCSLLRNPAKRL